VQIISNKYKIKFSLEIPGGVVKGVKVAARLRYTPNASE